MARVAPLRVPGLPRRPFGAALRWCPQRAALLLRQPRRPAAAVLLEERPGRGANGVNGLKLGFACAWPAMLPPWQVIAAGPNNPALLGQMLWQRFVLKSMDSVLKSHVCVQPWAVGRFRRGLCSPPLGAANGSR